MHELATNSLKYGALSVTSGTLDLSCSIHVDDHAADIGPSDDVVLVWTERGGPSVAPSAAEVGFGTTMVERTMLRQLGGSIETNWAPDGVIVTLRMNKDRLVT